MGGALVMALYGLVLVAVLLVAAATPMPMVPFTDSSAPHRTACDALEEPCESLFVPWRCKSLWTLPCRRLESTGDLLHSWKRHLKGKTHVFWFGEQERERGDLTS